MIVKLQKQHSDYPDLTPGKPYVVIGIEADDLRILNDQGRPFLFTPELFEIIDPHEPGDWVSEIGEDGERYAYPPSLNVVGFFDDFFTTSARRLPPSGGWSINALLWRRGERSLKYILQAGSSQPMAQSVSPNARRRLRTSSGESFNIEPSSW